MAILFGWSKQGELMTLFFLLLVRTNHTFLLYKSSCRGIPSNRQERPVFAQHGEKSLESTKRVSVTVPRFFNGEIAGGTYPSPFHTIHVQRILSNDEARECLTLATNYAEVNGCWDQPDSDRHSTYSTCDFPIEDNENLASYLNDIGFDDRMFDALGNAFSIDSDFMCYLDFFCAHYQALDSDGNTKTIDRLAAHRDGSLLSFTVLLNDPSAFHGGGTFFDGLRDVAVENDNLHILQPNGVIRPGRAGDATLHSGKLLHGADVVTSGSRTVLVGFVDVEEWLQRQGALSMACRDFGRMDVASFHYRRQLKKACQGEKGGWILNNSRWIYQSETEGRSCIKGYVPALKSIKRRADPEYQRRKKLEAEDRLLRSILLAEDDLDQLNTSEDGDITIL